MASIYPTTLHTGLYSTADIEKLYNQDQDNLPTDTSFSNFINIPANTYITEIQYRCNKIWATVLIFCLIILLISGILNIILEYHIMGPDILGCISSLTRDNIHCPLPKGYSTMDGDERARLLRDIHIRLTDVNAKNEPGHLAVVWCDPDKNNNNQRTFNVEKEYH